MSDLVTFGETMLRLSPPGHERLEAASELEVRAAGAESNVAVAAQRLGLSATWLSKVPDSAPGRKVARELEGYGIDTEIVWSEEGRQGTYYLEQAGKPRGANVIYDRANSAVSTAETAEIPEDIVADADVFFTTGITPALSPTLRETTGDLLELAQDSGTRTAFDFNYRRKLWDPETAGEALSALFPAIDVIVIAARDARNVLGLDGDAHGLAETLGDEYSFDTVVLTRGGEGVSAWHDGAIHDQGAYDTDTHDPIGTGDAFTGGYLARRAAGDDVPAALEYAAATAALKRTIPGDVALITADEVESVVSHGAEEISR
ncbi:sugar kinase [Halobacteria archaeon AArc-dxtr1]|nr:sugar kinase [Halobacteria archaeon AArc-dxtr1]